MVGVDVVGEGGTDGSGGGGGRDAVEVALRDRRRLVGGVFGGDLVAEGLVVGGSDFGNWT